MRAWEKCRSAAAMATLAGILGGVYFSSLYCGTYVIRLMKPITAIAHVTTMIGLGQRTTAVPTLRQPRVESARFGSNRPTLDPTTTTAGASVSAANTITNSAIAQGNPMVWKYGSRVALRHSKAPAMVRPEPRITCETPWYAV